MRFYQTIQSLPIDSIPTDRFRPKGLKEKRRDRWSWQNTAWRSLATICSNTFPHTEIRHGAALPPCRDGAWWQIYNLSEVDVFWGDPFSTDRFRPDGLKERAKGIRGRKIFRPYGKSVGFITPSRHRRCKRMRGSSEMMKRRRRAFMLNTLRDPSKRIVAVCGGKKGRRTPPLREIRGCGFVFYQ